MNKKRLIFIILLIILFLTGCGDVKQPLNKETFKQKLEQKGFTVVEKPIDANNNPTKIETYYIATPPEITYQFDIIIYTNESSALATYARIRENFGGKGYHNELNVGNFSKYTQICNDQYSVVSRVGSTVLHTHVDNKYRDEVNNILKEIGY